MPPRSYYIRQRDADLLEASLGRLPRRVARPSIVVMIGLPGSGKSFLARAVAKRAPIVILDSDALRAVLFPEPKHTKPEHARLFPAIHVLIERLLARGNSMIVDATNLKEANRRPFHKLAEKYDAPVVLVRTWAPVSIIRKRLAERTTPGPHDYSSATWDVYEKMRDDVEPIRKNHLTVDTSKDIGPAVDTIVAMLQS